MIYIVTSGSHEEYTINAVFSTKEKAEQYAIEKNSEGTVSTWNLRYEDYCVEEYVVDGESVEGKELSPVYSVELRLDDGSLIEENSGLRVNGSELQRPKLTSYSVRALSQESKEHALKLATEARQEWLKIKDRSAFTMSNASLIPESVLQEHFTASSGDDGSIEWTPKEECSA